MSIRFCFAVTALCLVASPAWAQQHAAASPRGLAVALAEADVDSRWTGWLGCWQQLEDTVRDESVPDALRDADPRPTPGVMVCVTPSGTPAGVTFNTVVDKQASLEETVVADGTNRPIDEAGCQGSQRARWSENGRRLFAHAELTCTDGSTRTISGLTTIAPGPMWVDIQAVTIEGRESIRVRRYRPASDQSTVSSRLTPDQLAAAAVAARQAASFNLDEVKEASAKVTPSTVEAALIETNASFPLNAKRLEELDAAGVPDRVLDLMIALSFPNRFVVERRTSSSGSSGWSGSGIGASGWVDPGYLMFPYHYAPFGYGMWGAYDGYSTGVPVFVVDVEPGPRPSGEGRVVDGLGYTRVRSRDPQPANMAGGSGGAGGTSSGVSGNGGGGGVSTQGYSGGGGDSGRTAVSRPPGQ